MSLRQTFAAACVAVPVSLLAFAGAAHASAERIAYPSKDLPGLPYSAAVKADGMVYVSGVLGHQPGKPQPVAGGVKAEAEQALAHIQAILEEAGSSMQNVVKCMVLLADIDGFPQLNEAYRQYFPQNPPARSTVIVPALPHGALIEIECNALAGK